MVAVREELECLFLDENLEKLIVDVHNGTHRSRVPVSRWVRYACDRLTSGTLHREERVLSNHRQVVLACIRRLTFLV